ncbi:MAG TPA: histidine kinase N-terminal 7TM domain-containing protein [Methanotrichaceae archaeon]|nr:histidine kinase N-terminal 7TM domain-containing protein [Methanotrichaceae archaeon]
MPHVPYLLLHLLSFVILVSLGVYSFRFRKVPVAFYFGIAMMLTALLVLAFTLEISSASLAEKVFWRKMFFIPVALEAVAFLVMAIYYLGQTHWLSRRRIAALMVVPAITILLTLTSDYHSLLRYNYHIDTSGPFPVLLWSNGPWFWVHIIFTYSMFVLTLALLFRFTRKDHPRYYRQTLIVMTGFLIPLITDMLFVIWKITPIPGYNPSVVVSAISGLMVAYGIFHYRIMDIVPVARSKVMDMIGDPLLVLDDQNRVLDFNRAMQTIPGFAEPLAIGQPADSVLGGLLNRYLTNSSARDKIWLGEEDHQMIFDLSISPIEDDHGNCLGRLFLFHDICEIEQARDVANQNAAQLSEANLELQKEIVERQAAEDALGRSEERLRLTLDAVNDGVWDWNIPADDVIFSPRWYTMLGYEPYEFPPSYASWRRLVHPDDIDLLERTIREHIAGAEGYASRPG